MRVQDVMTDRVHTVSPDIAAENAWNMMRLRRIHHLVVTRAGRVVGLLSDRDVGGAKGALTRANRTVADLMTPKVLTVLPTTPIRKAANLMRGQSVGCLVVADGARIVGIITVADLLELMGRGLDRPVATTTRPALNHRGPHRKRHSAAGVW
jgi:acetoin utilization protein AcuB